MQLSSFKLAQPALELRGLVRNYWLLDARLIGQRSLNEAMRIEGGSGWMMVLEGEARFETGRCGHGAFFDASTGSSNRLLGIDQTYIIGIRFCPGALRRFSSVPATAYRSSHLPLSHAGLPTRQVLQTLANVPSWHHQVQVLDHWLSDALRHPTTSDAIISNVISHIFDTSAPLAASQLSQISGLSERQLQRLFRVHVGLSPHRLGRVVRANRALRHLRNERYGAINLGDIAAEHGYFDQAHMAREFKGFFGTAPSGFLRHRAAEAC